jgi:hypothetical protein
MWGSTISTSLDAPLNNLEAAAKASNPFPTGMKAPLVPGGAWTFAEASARYSADWMSWAAASRLGATLAGIPFVDPVKHAVEGVPRTAVVGLLVSRKFPLGLISSGVFATRVCFNQSVKYKSRRILHRNVGSAGVLNEDMNEVQDCTI